MFSNILAVFVLTLFFSVLAAFVWRFFSGEGIRKKEFTVIVLLVTTVILLIFWMDQVERKPDSLSKFEPFQEVPGATIYIRNDGHHTEFLAVPKN